MNTWVLFVMLFFLGVMVSDFSRRKVPNLILLFALILQLPWLLLCGQSGQLECAVYEFDWISSAAGFLLGFAFLPFWLKRIMGAGDVKFIAVLGFVLGWKSSLWIVLISGVPAGVYALCLFFYCRHHGRKENRGVPYAGFIALTAIVWLIWKLLE